MNSKYMKLACQRARNGFLNNQGGPFGALIVDKEGHIVSMGNNQVIKNNDPTAHAEIQAIREACQKLGTYDLNGYVLYSTCEPCPMCLSAIIWSNIKEMYYAATREDAASVGFRDDLIYEYLKGNNKVNLKIEKVEDTECRKVFEEYKEQNGTIY